MNRPSFDEYFITLARVVALRSTCNRKRVGAALVRDKYLLSTGYGGSVVGQPHCTEVGCDIDPQTGGCVRTVHAEVNTVLQAAKHGVNTEGSTLYCTLSPCKACFRLLINAGVRRIVYAEEYRVPPDKELASSCGVSIESLPTPDLVHMPEAELQRLYDERRQLYVQLSAFQKKASDDVLARRVADAALALNQLSTEEQRLTFYRLVDDLRRHREG